MRYDTPGLRDEDFVPIHPHEDQIDTVIRAHPDWSDELVADQLTDYSITAGDVANFRRDHL
jgi:hypothetical protein